MDDRCLVPISVDSQLFRSRVFGPALRMVLSKHSDILFFVADQLQMYNKACDVQSPAQLGDLLAKFREGRYVAEREAWLHKLIHEMIPVSDKRPKWTVRGMQDWADARFCDVFKAITLLYHTHKGFQRDIRAAARTHLWN